MRKMLTTPSIVFKGSGWAKKDARDARPAARTSTAGGDKSEGGSGDKPAGDKGSDNGKGASPKGEAGPSKSAGTAEGTSEKAKAAD
jgi:hypothetical protein